MNSGLANPLSEPEGVTVCCRARTLLIQTTSRTGRSAAGTHTACRRRVGRRDDIPSAGPCRDQLVSTMKSSTGDQVRVHRVLLHRRAVVERVLPLGAPPLEVPATLPREAVTNTRQCDDRSLLDRLGPSGRASNVGDVLRDDRSLVGDRRGRPRDSERSSWMRYLMNVHMMWVD
jgi:hypothetical protein